MTMNLPGRGGLSKHALLACVVGRGADFALISHLAAIYWCDEFCCSENIRCKFWFTIWPGIFSFFFSLSPLLWLAFGCCLSYFMHEITVHMLYRHNFFTGWFRFCQSDEITMHKARPFRDMFGKGDLPSMFCCIGSWLHWRPCSATHLLPQTKLPPIGLSRTGILFMLYSLRDPKGEMSLSFSGATRHAACLSAPMAFRHIVCWHSRGITTAAVENKTMPTSREQQRKA